MIKYVFFVITGGTIIYIVIHLFTPSIENSPIKNNLLYL